MDGEHLLEAVEESPPFVSGETWQDVAAEYCVGSKAHTHDHFFDEFRNFGSVNAQGQRVDEGSYKIIDSDTFRIGRATFDYKILGGETLVMDPVITKAQRREALANPGEFTDATWMVSVALPGTSWHRVDCGSWC
jgi:hypothetical protein